MNQVDLDVAIVDICKCLQRQYRLTETITTMQQMKLEKLGVEFCENQETFLKDDTIILV